jgi:uncharacterized protein YjbJ (UPF0337 family)
MNKETLEGKFDQVSGAVKQKVGETFNDQSLANSGVVEQVKGAAKETWGKTKDVANDRKKDADYRAEAEKDSVQARTQNSADDLRDKIVNKVQDAKENISEKLDHLRDKNNA